MTSSLSHCLRVLVAMVPVAWGAMACGDEIGDPCSLSSDCSADGSRICDSASFEGYCTIQGCDENSCPEDSACIRFFTGAFANRPCDPATEDVATDMCAADELCALEGECVPRSSEVRYCMKTCGENGDCRDGYECRDLELMKAHGGEPVLAAGQVVTDSAPNFCATSPSN